MKSLADELALNQVVQARVLSVELEKNRISLSLLTAEDEAAIQVEQQAKREARAAGGGDFESGGNFRQSSGEDRPQRGQVARRSRGA